MAINRHPENVIAPSFSPLIALGALCVCILFLYCSVFTALFHQWRGNVMYSHGPLVPVISLYLLWTQRERLLQIDGNPRFLTGFPILLAGVAMFLLGYGAAVLTVQELSLLLTITGCSILVLGLPSLKVLWLPIGYLLFMMPVWEELVTGHFQAALQNLSAQNAVSLLNLMGIPAYREGVFIQLPGVVLEVAKACSGVNHIIAVVAIGIPLAYLFLKGWARRITLLAVAVTVAILSNALRVALVGVCSYLQLGTPLHGPFHIFQGLFVSAVGYVVLIFFTWILHTRGSSFAEPAQPRGRTAILSKVAGIAPTRAMVLSAVIVGAAGAFVNFHTLASTPLRMELDLLPQEIGSWTEGPKSSPVSFSGIFRAAGVDNELRRTYRNGVERTIQLYVGYFEHQDSAKKVISYRTEELHRGASSVQVQLGLHETIKVNRSYTKAGDRKTLVMFWYDINGSIAADRIQAKTHMLWEALVHSRNNGAIVIVASDFAQEEEAVETEEDLKAFIKEAYPFLRRCLPCSSHLAIERT